MAKANIGFEEILWKVADKLRGSLDAAEYKYVMGFQRCLIKECINMTLKLFLHCSIRNNNLL